MVSLTDKAMLGRLTITQWTARKHDKKVSQEVADNHGASLDSGRYNKVLVSKAALATLQSAANAARTFHYENTLPWATDGARILPAANFFAYSERMRALRAEFDAQVRTFTAGYPDFVADARTRLNGLFNAADYPSVREIERRFSFDVEILPMPDAGDFRVTLGDDEAARIRADIQARCDAAVAGAVRDLWTRVHDAVKHMAERLRSYTVDDATGKVSNPFRDSLVTNLRELADLLPRLNVTGDPDLDRMRERLCRELAPHDPATLRDNGAVREQVAKSAEDILAAMAGYIGA